MFKKFNILTLIIILAILAGVYLLLEMGGEDERTFKEQLVAVDTAKMTELIVTPPRAEQVHLKKFDGNWYVLINDDKYLADSAVLTTTLETLLDLKALYPSAIDRKAWAKYHVDDTSGIKVIAKKGNKTLANFIVGKMEYMSLPDPRSPGKNVPVTATHIRLPGDENVYLVREALYHYSRKPSDYRKKTLAKVRRDRLNKLTFEYPNDQTFILEKQNNRWLFDGQTPDSLNTIQYINRIVHLRGMEFADGFNPTGKRPDYQLTMEGKGFDPITISAFHAGYEDEFILTSSINNDNAFIGSNANLFSRIFVQREHFLPE